MVALTAAQSFAHVPAFYVAQCQWRSSQMPQLFTEIALRLSLKRRRLLWLSILRFMASFPNTGLCICCPQIIDNRQKTMVARVYKIDLKACKHEHKVSQNMAWVVLELTRTTLRISWQSLSEIVSQPLFENSHNHFLQTLNTVPSKIVSSSFLTSSSRSASCARMTGFAGDIVGLNRVPFP